MVRRKWFGGLGGGLGGGKSSVSPRSTRRSVVRQSTKFARPAMLSCPKNFSGVGRTTAVIVSASFWKPVTLPTAMRIQPLHSDLT